MKTNLLLVGAFALLVGCTATAKTNEYVVIAGKSVVEDSLWNQVAQALVEKHGAASLSYNESPEELLPQLRELRPRYVAIVEKPENLGRDYVIALNQMSRRVDNDIYADFIDLCVFRINDKPADIFIFQQFLSGNFRCHNDIGIKKCHFPIRFDNFILYLSKTANRRIIYTNLFHLTVPLG